jgi:glutamine---fructose-6-phosphate transaminase (isomerizing)
MSEEPELRPGPPWAMEEMIEAEPELAEPILAAPAAEELARAVASAAHEGEPVVVAGCGTSEHAAMGGAAMLADALGPVAGRAVRARDAFEAALAPQAGGVLIGISHEAGTPATLAALRAAAAGGARTLLVTALPDRAPEGVATLGTPIRDRSWCHTVGYVSPLLALHAVASWIRGGAPDAAAARAAVEAVLARRALLAERAAVLLGCERLLAVGGGVDEVGTRELALKVEEGVHVPTTPLGIEKVLHGHLPAAGDRTGLVILRLDPRAAAERDARAANVLAAARELRMPAAQVGAAELPPPEDLPSVDGALLSGALALQLLTLELVMAAGTNPDLIRREEAPYRAAAEAAGAG